MAKASRSQPVARPRVVESGRWSTLSPPLPSEHGGTDNRSRRATAAIHSPGGLPRGELRALWIQELGERPPATLGRDALALAIAYARQERRQGGLSKTVARELDRLFDQTLRGNRTGKAAVLTVLLPRSGTILVREWQGTTHHVTVVDGGFLWNGKTFRSLSRIARAITGTSWNGPRFFGMRDANGKTPERDNG
jgi:hypothetical protein